MPALIRRSASAVAAAAIVGTSSVARAERPCRCSVLSTGMYLGIDGGEARSLTSPSSEAVFGAHAGYRFAGGLAIDLRFDELAVLGRYAGGFGVRYTVPARTFALPFAEVHVGPRDGTTAADLGLGLAIPIGSHVELSLAVRDWVTAAGTGPGSGPTHTMIWSVGFTVGWPRAGRRIPSGG
jgi:hypothetical protein